MATDLARIEQHLARSQRFAGEAVGLLVEDDDSMFAGHLRDLELAAEILRQMAARMAGVDQRSLARLEVQELAARAIEEVEDFAT